jgi:hypothetical protein
MKKTEALVRAIADVAPIVASEYREAKEAREKSEELKARLINSVAESVRDAIPAISDHIRGAPNGERGLLVASRPWDETYSLDVYLNGDGWLTGLCDESHHYTELIKSEASDIIRLLHTGIEEDIIEDIHKALQRHVGKRQKSIEADRKESARLAAILTLLAQ